MPETDVSVQFSFFPASLFLFLRHPRSILHFSLFSSFFPFSVSKFPIDGVERMRSIARMHTRHGLLSIVTITFTFELKLLTKKKPILKYKSLSL